MKRLMLAGIGGLALCAMPVPSAYLPIGASTAEAQYTIGSGVRRVCRTVFHMGRSVVQCVASRVQDGWARPRGGLGGIGGFGPAGIIVGAMGGNRSVPHEWYPYRNREEATYYANRRDQLGRRVHGPYAAPSPYHQLRRAQLGFRQGPAYIPRHVTTMPRVHVPYSVARRQQLGPRHGPIRWNR
jgi:hypothetical protein